MNLEYEIELLISRVRELEDRLRSLEVDVCDGSPVVGFDLDEVDEFDEDASEY
jgi:hypothetical protein